jgi:hypothetical protein
MYQPPHRMPLLSHPKHRISILDLSKHHRQLLHRDNAVQN